MPNLLPFLYYLEALVAAVSLVLAPLLFSQAYVRVGRWWARAGERQQRIAIARAEVHVRHLEGQLQQAKANLAALRLRSTA